MKSGSYFLVATLMIVGLLLTSNPALAWPDAMPHFGDGGCLSHMRNPTHVGKSPYKFYLCKANSQSISWTAYIRNKVTGFKPSNCGVTNQQVPANGISTFTCSVPAGAYTATISYTVSGSQPFPVVDSYYVSP